MSEQQSERAPDEQEDLTLRVREQSANDGGDPDDLGSEQAAEQEP
jgi:hypothetical protein